MNTPMWARSRHSCLNNYNNTPYKESLARYAKWLVEDSQSGHPAERIGRYYSHNVGCWHLHDFSDGHGHVGMQATYGAACSLSSILDYC